MKTAREWKSFYREEREMLGVRGLERLIESAPEIAPAILAEGGAIVFPHTRLCRSGALVAAAARAVVESGRDCVFALGVLHGARAADAKLVQRAREGEEDALAQLRRVHCPNLEFDQRRWTDEFSLDNFIALVDVAARMRGRKPPRVEQVYPFLVGNAPDTLEGLTPFLESVEMEEAIVVATTDPMHHGIGYQTAPERLLRNDEAALRVARESIALQFEQLKKKDYDAFQTTCETVRSDFRDVGPVLAELVPVGSYEFVNLQLVDYGDVLNAADPTWVAAALVTTTSR